MQVQPVELLADSPTLTPREPAVIDVIDTAYIIAHKEELQPLIQALASEGLQVEVIQGPYSEAQRTYSAALRCLVNHANAWRALIAAGRPALIVEADFVPVRGFGQLPLPCPVGGIDASLIYLYACGPEFWDLVNDHIARGHSGGMVAYVVSPAVASLMLAFCAEELQQNPFGQDSAWDSVLGDWLKERGIESYLPYRH